MRSRKRSSNCERLCLLAYSLEPYYDQSELVRESIRSVRDAILIGLLLACIILFLFLSDWTSSLVAGLVIPVTVAITILFMWAIGESFNLMTLGGLAAAIGLVIDDAIVVVENIVSHRDRGETRAQAARLALREIAVPLVGSTITPVVVFLPLVSVTGVTGSFFRALAITMTVCASYFAASRRHLDSCAQPGLPARAARWQRAKKHDEHGRIMRKVLQWHERGLEWSLSRPFMLLGLCGFLAVGSFFCYRGLGSDLSARDGRRRIHPRLHYARRQLSLRDEPGVGTCGTNSAQHAGSRKHIAANRPSDGTRRRSPRPIPATSR